MEESIQIKNRRMNKADTIKLLLTIIFIVTVFLPLIRMFMYMDGESFRKVFQSAQFKVAVVHSLCTAGVGTLITVIVAFVLAICIQRTNICCKGLFKVIFALPMLIPSISNGMGLVILFGNNGIITRFFGLETSIYGFLGIICGSVMYAFPVAYLMLEDIISYEDGSPYEAATVLGIPKIRQLTAIMFPYLRKPFISVVFAVFTMIITDYGVPLMVGGKYTTIATVMYQEVIGQLDFSKGVIYGSILLIPAGISFVIDFVNKDKGKMGFVTRPCNQTNNFWAKLGAYLCCFIVSMYTLLPIVAFILLAFTMDYPYDLGVTLQNVTKTMNLRAGEYFLNSCSIAFLTAILGVTIAFFTAYMTARMKSSISRFLHLASLTSAAIPGIVLGLSYVLTFNTTWIYGTIIILVMVNLVHFISSPYLMMYNSFSKINADLEGVASVMGIGRKHLLKDVFIPQCKGTLLEMFSYFFVNCMMTISAVSFLASTRNKPISLMINQFEAQMQLECAAVVSLIILIVNIIMKWGMNKLKKYR